MAVGFIVQDAKTRRRAEVTETHALKVSLVERTAVEISVEELTRRKVLRTFLKNNADSQDLTVDGSSTEAEFFFGAANDRTSWVTAVRIILNDTKMEIATKDFRRFGTAATSPGLTNGLQLEIQQGGIITDVFPDPVKTIGDFLNYTDTFTSLPNSVSSQEDFLSFDIDLEVPVAFVPGSTDKILMRVRDDLTDVDKFEVLLRGYQELIE